MLPDISNIKLTNFFLENVYFKYYLGVYKR